MGVYIPYRRLPSEYQEVEYIQSSGSGNSGQYIDTGFVPDPYYFKLYLDFKSRINYGACNINGRPQYNFASYMDYTLYETFFGTSISPHIRYNITQGVRYKYTLEANNGTATLTDENGTVLQTITYSGTLQATGAYNFGIFRRQEQSQYTDYSDGTLYACKMYTTNDVLVRDFVPCYRKSDNEIGLYDLVNDQFYTNSGTGTFTKGADVNVQKELQNAYIGQYPPGWDMDKWTLAQTSSALSSIWRGGVYFNNDGTKIFLSQYGNGGRVYECALSTPYDITTINNFNKYISVEHPEDIHFSQDGTKLFVLKSDVSPYQVKRYTLSTARDISTATNDQNITRDVVRERGLYITPDGLNIYTSSVKYSQETPNVYHATLSTARDLSTASSFSIISTSLGGIGIYFGDNGKMFFKQDEGESNLSYYNLSTPYDLSTATLGGTKNVGTNRAGGIWFNNNGTMCTMVGGGGGTNYITKYTLS